ncbi:hypothetical protein [Methanolobus vulcani]|uniref:Uncharacterized protein n=1 Tax=Methanolobus vulcani TaxID=38026 RepID=A0A7Z8KRI9_9EURY|nr:hypothetical protein [Methanolobus vulcani]TQD27929.1 hypothetical protein FKV42_02385 [Methanolobus vulcani]
MDKNKSILSAAIVVLLPLLPALIDVGYKLYLPIMEDVILHILMTIIVFGVPEAVIIYYGYTTGDNITSTLSGVFLIPLYIFYSEILLELSDPDFIMAGLGHWLRIITIIDLVIPALICGVMGYCASKRTRASLLVSIFSGTFLILIFVLIN